jgi:hypothetical protein
MNRKILALLMLLTSGFAFAKAAAPDLFYVYHDKMDKLNHYCPSGWMGDFGDLKIDEGDMSGPKDGRTAIKISYSGEAKQGANWAGIFWQNPPNNWGTQPNGGKDLTGYKKLTFWAKGAKGNERIAEFKAGGITGEFGDSDSANIGPVDLTKDWKQYTFDLKGKDLKSISGGFCYSASRDDNPEGFVFYLDEIRYER